MSHKLKVDPEAGRLPVFLIAVPIGNHLDDMSPAAFEALARVRHLFVESDDARLLDKLRDAGHLTDAHLLHVIGEGSDAEALAVLDGGEGFAILANSGLPCFIDPGYHIVRALLLRRLDQVMLHPVGASSALDAAMACSGLDLSRFVFLGHYPAFARFERALTTAHVPMIWYVAGRAIQPFLAKLYEQVPGIARTFVYRNLRSLSTQRIWVLTGKRPALPDDLEDGAHDNFVVIVEPGKERRFDTD